MQFLGTLCLGVLLLVGLLVLVWLIRKFGPKVEPPAGTYDQKNIDSGGSIGGMRGGRSYDSPKIDSGATIGGNRQRRAYDSPKHRSGASIGGGPRVGDEPGSEKPTPQTSSQDGWDIGEKADKYRTQKDKNGRVDSPDVKSGGSFGG
jgi:hypothetical protein